MTAKTVTKRQNVARRSLATTPTKKTTAQAKPRAGKPAVEVKAETKIDTIGKMLRRKEGATLEQIMVVTDWQQHSVRGALAGSIPKKFGQSVTSTKTDGVRVYRLGA